MINSGTTDKAVGNVDLLLDKLSLTISKIGDGAVEEVKDIATEIKGAVKETEKD